MSGNDLTRPLPHNRDFEYSVVGGLMMDPRKFPEVDKLIKAEDFHTTEARTAYEAAHAIYARGDTVDQMTVIAQLEATGKLKLAGDKIGILDMASMGIGFQTVGHAEKVRELSIQRNIVRAGLNIMNIGYEAEEEAEGAISRVMGAVMDIMRGKLSKSKTAKDVINNLLKKILEGDNDYITPPDLPAARLRPGDLVVVAAGTSAGKTALSLNWADKWSETRNVTYFEYEMTETDLMGRLVAKHSGVPLYKLQDGNFNMDEYEHIRESVIDIAERKLRIEEVWCDITTLMSKIRSEAMEGQEIFFIDHIGLVPFNRAAKSMSEAKAIGVNITNPLKRLASELGIIIVILVQLNREGQRGDFPKLYHLRDSGEIEQDASVVFMLWSDRTLGDDIGRRTQLRQDSHLFPDYHDLMDETTNLVRIGVEKNRNGMCFNKFMRFHGESFSYETEPRVGGIL